MATIGLHGIGAKWNSFSGKLCRLENVTRASIDKEVSSKWEKFQFWVNYAIKLKLKFFTWTLNCFFNILFFFFILPFDFFLCPLYHIGIFFFFNFTHALIAFINLFARCLIWLWRKSPNPSLDSLWIRDVLNFVKLEKKWIFDEKLVVRFIFQLYTWAEPTSWKHPPSLLYDVLDGRLSNNYYITPYFRF